MTIINFFCCCSSLCAAGGAGAFIRYLQCHYGPQSQNLLCSVNARGHKQRDTQFTLVKARVFLLNSFLCLHSRRREVYSAPSVYSKMQRQREVLQLEECGREERVTAENRTKVHSVYFFNG